MPGACTYQLPCCTRYLTLSMPLQSIYTRRDGFFLKRTPARPLPRGHDCRVPIPVLLARPTVPPGTLVSRYISTHCQDHSRRSCRLVQRTARAHPHEACDGEQRDRHDRSRDGVSKNRTKQKRTELRVQSGRRCTVVRNLYMALSTSACCAKRATLNEHALVAL